MAKDSRFIENKQVFVYAVSNRIFKGIRIKSNKRSLILNLLKILFNFSH